MDDMNDDLLHGGALGRMLDAFPDAPQPWIDLSTGINPWPYPASAISATELKHLPTQEAVENCTKAMERQFGAPEASVLPTPGTEIAIRLLPLILKARKVAIADPIYGDHVTSWEQSGAQVVRMNNVLCAVDDKNVQAIVVCNPNNPDGRQWDRQELLDIHTQLIARGATLVVDEAYVDLTPGLSLADHGGHPGLVVLRSFGKFFGLAGIRLGAVLASNDILDALHNLLGVWSVSSPALEIAAHAYADLSWQEATRRRLKQKRTEFDALLTGVGMDVTSGTDLYRYLDVRDAHDLWRHLAEKGIYIRRFSWTNRYVRVGLPETDQDAARVAEAIGRRNSPD